MMQQGVAEDLVFAANIVVDIVAQAKDGKIPE